MPEVRVRYKNWKGEVEVRRIIPQLYDMRFDKDEWHPEPQYLLEVFDEDKDTYRTFAMSGILEWGVPEEDDTPIRDDYETDKLLFGYGFHKDETGANILQISDLAWLVVECDGTTAIQSKQSIHHEDFRYIALPVVVKCLGDIRRLLSALGYTLTKKD